MRRSTAIIIVAIIFSTLPFQAVKAEVGVEPPDPFVDVERDIRIENAGIVWVTDEFTLRAQNFGRGSTPFSPASGEASRSGRVPTGHH